MVKDKMRITIGVILTEEQKNAFSQQAFESGMTLQEFLGKVMVEWLMLNHYLKNVELTPIEQKIIKAFLPANEAKSRAQIIEQVWGYADDNMLAIRVRLLRRKLADTNFEIVTNRGFGYTLCIGDSNGHV